MPKIAKITNTDLGVKHREAILELMDMAECAVSAENIQKGLREELNVKLSLEAIRRNLRKLVIANKLERLSSRTAGRFDLNWRTKVYSLKIPDNTNGEEEWMTN